MKFMFTFLNTGGLVLYLNYLNISYFISSLFVFTSNKFKLLDILYKYCKVLDEKANNYQFL